MTKDTPAHLKIQFPLDLVCPDCGKSPITTTAIVPAYVNPDKREVVDVEMTCACGRRVNYGSKPAEFFWLNEAGETIGTAKTLA